MQRIHTLGRFELRGDDAPNGSVVSTQPKRLALLVYLACAHPRGFHRRDTLLGLFWPELGQDEARRALRQALHHLRQVLGDDAITTRSDDQVGLNEGAISCDAVELERALSADRHADALALYNGDFLAGVFIPDVAVELEEWIDRTRTDLRGRISEAAWRLANQESALGHSAAAANAATRANELTPDDEPALRRLIELLDTAGRRADALTAYDRFAKRLEKEFDEQPDAETVALVDRIRLAPPRQREFERAPAIAVPKSEGAANEARSYAATGGTPRVRRAESRPALAIAGLVAAVALVLASWSLRGRSLLAAGSVSPRDRLLVVDFRDRTRDSTLGATIAEALRVDLAQSALVRVMTGAQVRGALQRMERPVEVTVDDSLARSIALREGVKAFITGDVSSVGSRYVLSARVVTALSGDEIAAVRETAQDSTDLIAAIDRLSGALRRRLGEKLAAIQADPPLRQVTTASLEALRLYTRAMYAKDVKGDRVGAVVLLQAAIALDTAFATAYRMLGSTYAAMVEPGKADWALSKAVAHRDRLPFRDRYLTMGSYYRNVTGEYAKAASSYEALLELYPTDVAGLNNLGLVYSEQRRYAQAETLFRRVAAVDSTLPSVYIAIAEMLALQSRFDAAGATLDTVRQRFPDYAITDLTATYVAAASQDWPSAERHIRRRLEQAKGRPSTEISALLTLGQIEMVMGRLADAERDLRAAMRIADTEASPHRYLGAGIALAWMELRYRARPVQAIERVSATLQRFPLGGIDAADRPYTALAELYAALDQGSRVRDLLIEVERDSAAAKAVGREGLHTLRGTLALAEGRGRDAVVELTQADVLNACPVCTLPALASAYEQAGDVERAVEIYERYLVTPWVWRFETDAPHVAWSLRRLAALYERQQQSARAAQQYSHLQQLWSNADPEMSTLLMDVRANHTRLRGGNRPP